MPRLIPPRGEPLTADTWYVSPVRIEDEEGKEPPVQARQGDIFSDVPSAWVAERPVRVASDFKPQGDGRVKYLATYEDDQRAYDWTDGEQVVVSATRGFAVLLTQDCELDKPRAMFTMAMVKPISDPELGDIETMSDQEKQSLEDRLTDIERMRNRLKYRSFYLQAQPETFDQAYVDFGRLTTLSRKALDACARHLSMTDDIRDALREDFVEFMTNERGDKRGDATT